MPVILWRQYFLDVQGYGVKENKVFQDTQSAILLEKNERHSTSSHHTCHINIHYFFVADQVEKGTLRIEYCPTKSMLADYMLKPLQGPLFQKFKDQLLGKSRVSLPAVPEQKECVGRTTERSTERSVVSHEFFSGKLSFLI